MAWHHSRVAEIALLYSDRRYRMVILEVASRHQLQVWLRLRSGDWWLPNSMTFDPVPVSDG